MQKIDTGLFIKLLPNKDMILTDVATETMRAEEICLGKSDSENDYKDTPIDTPIPEPKTDTEQKVEAYDYLTGRTESEVENNE